MDEDYQGLSKKERRELANQEKMEAAAKADRHSSLLRLLLWGGVFFILGLIGFFVWRLASSPPTATEVLGTQEEVFPNDWTKGNQDAPVTLIEYSDFQCPACGAYYPIVRKLTGTFNAEVRFVYRHFPLRQIHPNAERAARAAEAAGRQGKFWEMHDRLFEGQAAWSNERDPKETFISYAESLELDVEQFNRDYDDGTIDEKVKRDEQAGLRGRVNATPTFFLNGKKLDTPRDEDAFQTIIQQAIYASS